MAALIGPIFYKHQSSEKNRLFAERAFFLWCLATIPFFYLDIREKSTIPKFHCESENLSINEAVKCRFTLEGAPQILELHYEVINFENRPNLCQTFFKIGDMKKPSPDRLALAANEKKKVTTFFSYPQTEMTVTLSLDCREKAVAQR